jgi:LysM repeat protein
MQVAVGEKLHLQKESPSMPKLFGEKRKTTAYGESTAPAKEESTSAMVIVHVVQPKETVFSIARKYEVAVDEVKKWNDMDSTDLKIGQQIRINKSR